MAEQNNIQPGGDKPNQDIFSETLQRLASTDRDIIAVTSDSRGSGKLVPFGKQFPKQIVEVGIAEQNLVGVAAGLASCGKKVFAAMAAPTAIGRPCPRAPVFCSTPGTFLVG